MLLYVCPECGAWSDVSLVDAFAKALQPMGHALAKGLAEMQGLKVEEMPIEEPIGWACLLNAEHGLMRAVSPDDKLFIKSAIVEAEQGEYEASHEED